MANELASTTRLSEAERGRLANIPVQLGLFTNILLALAKTSIGILGHSTALLADGINSTSDVAYYVVVSLFVRRARIPADDKHPYGHTQYESIGAVVVAAFVITTAITIFWNSINTLVDMLTGNSLAVGTSMLTLWIALATIAIKIFLYFYTRSIGQRINNQSIFALAEDHRNDIFSALGVAIGITLARMGHQWVDPLAGALVALVILRTGISILGDSTSDLMDTVPGIELKAQAEQLLAKVPGVQGLDDMHAHRFGPYLQLNLTIFVDGALTVNEGNVIAGQAEDALREGIDFVRNVHVHYHARRTD